MLHSIKKRKKSQKNISNNKKYGIIIIGGVYMKNVKKLFHLLIVEYFNYQMKWS